MSLLKNVLILKYISRYENIFFNLEKYLYHLYKMDTLKCLKNILLSKFLNLGIIKKGEFKLKSGLTSGIYIDLRLLISYPNFFNYLNKLLHLQYPDFFDNIERIIPVPMGGLPFGYYLSSQHNIPALMVRDKIKDHGTKNIIEGIIDLDNDNIVIIEDVITTGTSILQMLDILSSYGKKIQNIKYILCICNRGSLTHLDFDKQHIPIISLFTLQDINEYISNQFPSYFSYSTNNYGSANSLYSLALRKNSNLIVSCDFMKSEDILELVNKIGNKIVACKLHLDCINISSMSYDNFVMAIQDIAETKNFMIIDDSKLGDIEMINIEKIKCNNLAIEDSVDAITIHALSGLDILKNNSKSLTVNFIPVVEMSCNNMIDSNYTKKIIDNIRTICNEIDNPNLLGLVCQDNTPKIIEPFEFLTMTPGISLDNKKDDGNQKYSIPSLKNKRGMFWIVGRAITQGNNIEEKIKNIEIYSQLGWEYFIKY